MERKGDNILRKSSHLRHRYNLRSHQQERPIAPRIAASTLGHWLKLVRPQGLLTLLRSRRHLHPLLPVLPSLPQVLQEGKDLEILRGGVCLIVATHRYA